MDTKFDDASLIDCMKKLEEEETQKIDKKVIDYIINEIKNYDVVDFLLKLIALNLNPYNQNKCIIFDEIVDGIVSQDVYFCSTQNKISMKYGKSLLKIYEEEIL